MLNSHIISDITKCCYFVMITMFADLIDIQHRHAVCNQRFLKIANMLVIWKFTNRETRVGALPFIRPTFRYLYLSSDLGCVLQYLETLELWFTKSLSSVSELIIWRNLLIDLIKKRHKMSFHYKTVSEGNRPPRGQNEEEIEKKREINIGIEGKWEKISKWSYLAQPG